jgi:hypothetical protein
MIPLEILNSKSLFSLLHKIDLQLAEQTRVRRCPFAGGRCDMQTIRASLGVALLIWMRHLRFVIACAAAVKGAGAVFSQHRSDSGSVGYTGRLFYSSSLPFDKDVIRSIPWNSSRAFAGYGVRPSTVGSTTFEPFFPTAFLIGVWPDTSSHRFVASIYPKRCWNDFAGVPRISKLRW